ncbi:hypothetical protein FKG94_26100 [Exilibacterium tricleocarpae]|uniref:DUF2232 domain-containing protein n=1 Tax=Exilibacterium tricleocarpae TaxID=2591008 RepID=A0A545SQL2_9GAMM|nr:hypothetical protein [Exilibacterium tricleocarpae]TQV67265.1 hypothetical protein FKG94_26100 [Exilibacterium tricleocarpae]
MRALAEFIMAGRVQAAVVVLLGSWLPLISPAAVALITLRRGAGDGALILLWALLPPLSGFFVGNVGPLMPYVSLGGLLTVYGAALVLRQSLSWGHCLTAVVALSCLTVLSAAWLMPDMAQQMLALFREILASLMAGQEELALSNVFVTGWLGSMTAVAGVLALLLARWWQALLYNPGGFQAEFHQLRLDPAQALVSLAATMYCLVQGGDYLTWLGVFAVPLWLAGVALVHFSVRVRQLGWPVLVVFYPLVVMLNPLSLTLLLLLAFSDTWMNFRARLKPKGSE